MIVVKVRKYVFDLRLISAKFLLLTFVHNFCLSFLAYLHSLDLLHDELAVAK